MTLVNVADLKTVPIVGAFYLVPHVIAKIGFFKGHWVPVYGGFHEDRDLGVAVEHYHLDPRFMTDAQMKKSYKSRVGVFGLVIEPLEPQAGPALMRRKCQRPLLQYPTWLPNFLPKLEQRFKTVKIGDDLVCPHRGMPLASLLPNEINCVTCPLHGLTWNVKTKDLHRTREEPK